MKRKIVFGIMLTLLLISTLSMAFHVVPVVATDEPIKMGVIGPIEWIQGQGMREGAMLAVEEINEAGGVLGRNLTIHIGDEGTTPERGKAEMERLCSVEKVHFIFGGLRTEIVYPMREVAMDYRIPFFITGSATPWLIDCFTTAEGPHMWPCGECVRCDYERYKYLFRVMPTNTDVLFGNFLVPYLRDHLIPNVLQPPLVEAGRLRPDGHDPLYPGYPDKVNVSVVVENLAWTESLRTKLDQVGPLFFGPGRTRLQKVGEHYYYAVSPLTKDFTPILAEIKERDTHLIMHVLSGEEGLAFIKQWKDMKVPAVPVGINTLSQESEMWEWTDGRCEYEAILGAMGTRTPIVPGLTEKFWDDYTTRWGHAPIHTSFGAYEAIYTIAEACEQAALDHPELTDPATWETLYETRELYDILIPYIENVDRIGILGRAKFTSTHDIFTGGWHAADKGLEEYVKPLILQWRKTEESGRLAVVSAGNGSHVYNNKTAPPWAPYVEEFQIPPWMLGLPVAIFDYSPETPTWDQTVAFDASASWDVDGYIVSYDWDFGDNTTDTGMVVNHTYTAPGVYNVTLTVTDNASLTNNCSAIVEITTRATAVYFNLNPNPVGVGETLTLKGILLDESFQLLSNENVRLYARPLAGSWKYITSLTTNGNGVFMWQTEIPVAGIFIVAVYYPGSEMYESTYNLAILIVQ